MKTKHFIYLFLLAFYFSFFIGCSDSTTSPISPDPTPIDSTVKLISPPDDTVYITPDSVTIIFKWHKTLNSQNYILSISGDSLFVYQNMYLIYGTTYEFHLGMCRPSPCKIYWRVRIYNPAPASRKYWSDIRSFTIIAP